MSGVGTTKRGTSNVPDTECFATGGAHKCRANLDKCFPCVLGGLATDKFNTQSQAVLLRVSALANTERLYRDKHVQANSQKLC